MFLKKYNTHVMNFQRGTEKVVFALSYSIHGLLVMSQ
jgi:hypothetical protein